TDRYQDDDRALPPTAVPGEQLRVARSGLPWHAAATRYLASLAVADLGLAAMAVALRVRQEHDAAMVAVLALAAGLGFVLTVAACRGYRAACASSTTEDLSSLVRAAGILALASLVVHYLGIAQVPRSLFFEALALSTLLAALARLAARPV